MCIALIADVHSNLEALRACMADARRRGAEQFALTPRQRRIGRLLIWITALEFAVFLAAVAIFVAAR